MKYNWNRRSDRVKAYQIVRRFLEYECQQSGFDRERLIYLGRKKFSSFKPKIIYEVVDDLEEKYVKYGRYESSA